MFDKRHALVPDVMNSKKWQDLLQNIQRVVLRIPLENRPLAVVLKHLRFAKRRFDSSAVSTSFLKSAFGDKAAQHNNAKMKRFQALTDQKK